MSSLKVRVQQGVVRGCEEKLPNGKSYLRFSGIPYAQPPINDLRFKSPRKLLKFNEEELDCTVERDACFQKSPLARAYIGSEDCLNLNVYVPVQTEPPQKLTVMVYLHGGGLKFDSNTKRSYSPEYLLMENVIVVVINYRLHILGFLSLPSMGISGNAGMKDQQMALEWIYENISNFNGDPENICLFGESGGAICAHLHVFNEKSRKFIKSVICQSGTAFTDNSFRGNIEKDARKVAKLLGCKGVSDEDVYNTLMTAPVKELHDFCEKDPSPTERRLKNRRWRIIIEKESDDAFLTKSSVETVIEQRGKINVPVLMGSNDGDGMPRVALNIRKLKSLNDDLSRTVPKYVRLNPKDSSAVAREIKRFYFADRDVSEETLPLVTLFTDTIYFSYQIICSEYLAKYQPGCKQYLYEFQFDGNLNLQKKLLRLQKLQGASHADDVFYLFGGELADKVNLGEDSREWKMRETMCKLWANFAKYHDPTPSHDNPLPFKWSPVENVKNDAKGINLDFLVINDNMKMVRNLNQNRTDFWRDVYEKWGNNPLVTKSKL